jgi:hypothetical protein
MFESINYITYESNVASGRDIVGAPPTLEGALKFLI